MTRRCKPNYFRSLGNLLSTVTASGAVLSTTKVNSMCCSMMPKTVKYAPILPTWLVRTRSYLHRFAIVFAHLQIPGKR